MCKLDMAVLRLTKPRSRQRGANPKSDGSEVVCDTLTTHYWHTTGTLPTHYRLDMSCTDSTHTTRTKQSIAPKTPKAQNFKNDFDVDNPSLNVDHQSNQ